MAFQSRGHVMSAQKTYRWLSLIDLLPAHGDGLTVREITTRLHGIDGLRQIHLRTVQRDLEELAASGIIQLLQGVNAAGLPTWRVDPNSHGLLGNGRHMDLSTAVTLDLVLRYMRGLLPPTAYEMLRGQSERAKQTLQLRREPGRRPWSDKIRVVPAGFTYQAPRIAPAVLKAVYSALASENQLRITYRRPGADETSTRDYSPIALIARPPAFHLLVSLAPERDPFVLAMHRIQKVQSLDARAQPPMGFDLDAYLSAGEINALVDDEKVIRLELKCHKALADHWRDAVLGREQTITTEGESARIAVSVHDTQALRAYLLGFATQIEVLAPATLRRWFKTETAALAARYATPAKRSRPHIPSKL